MIGELYYIFCRYGNQIAERYEYTECVLQLNTDGSGALLGFKPTIVASGTPPVWQRALSVVLLSWDTLDEGIKLLRKELAKILQSGGTVWT